MNRVAQTFAALRSQGRKGLIPFVVGGRPSMGSFPGLLATLERAGASLIEVGIPFSDPVADGPVIAAAMHRALEAGVTPRGVFEAVRSARPGVRAPLIAMVSVSVVERMGAGRFAQEAASAGFDGVIYPDAPLEEAARYTKPARDAGLTATLLVAPATPLDRAARIAEASDGFLYVLARAGITGGAGTPGGADTGGSEALRQRIAALRRATPLPLAVGFGISTPGHVRAVVEAGADAAIVGSALVGRLEEAGPGGDSVEKSENSGTHKFVCSLVSGLISR